MKQEFWNLVKEKYRSDVAFGQALGWIPQKVFKMKKGKYIPKVSEAVEISKALDIDLETVANFFS